MSDTLKERLNSHSDAFKGLLSLIPAKYYYDEDTKSQWNKKKGSKEDAHRANRAKFDPDSGSSALDESNRRETRAKEQEDDDDDDEEDEDEASVGSENESEVSVIFDDTGNAVYLSGHEESEDEDSEADPSPATTAASAKENGKASKVEKAEKAAKAQEAKNAKAAAPKPSAKDAANEKNGKSKSENGKSKKELEASSSATENTKSRLPARDAPGIEELRLKLAAKINEMRSQRKAPGSTASGAPKNREELLAARMKRQEQKQKLKRKRDDSEAISDAESEDDQSDNEDDEPVEADNVMFGQVQLSNGQRLGKDLSLEEQKKLKKRNATDQLKVLEGRKAKISDLAEDKQKEITDKANWSRAILKSEGAKLRDNEKMLKKTVKQQKRKKLKSELAWRERLDNVAKGIADREAKRNANLAARKEAKFNKNKKKKPKRAGFEGKKRRH